MLLRFPALGQNNDSWKQIESSGSGSVTFYWYPTNVQIRQSRDAMDGVEYELAEDFISYLEKKFKVTIESNWVKAKGFNELLDTMRLSHGGVFGLSSISITESRKQVLNFSPPYFPDICVIVSGGNIHIGTSEQELKETLNGLTAVTIENTTLNMGLLGLKEKLKIDFDIIYVDNSGAIIETISDLDNAFGYVDLSNFLSSLPDSPNLKRQVLHPLKLEGLGMVYPQNSDWSHVVNDYFSSEQYQAKKHEVINKYMGENVDHLIDDISQASAIGPSEEIAILTEEVEVRYKEQLEAEIAIREDAKVRNLLITGLLLILILTIFLYILNRMKSSANAALAKKREQIEGHNRELFNLNKEKNDLIGILAHDLRNPIAKIIGFSGLLKESPNLSEDEKSMISFIERSSEYLTGMIGKILDVSAIESGKRNFKVEKLDIHPIIEKVVSAYETISGRKNIQLTYSPTEKIGMGMGDKVYLPQVIENLVSNAIKFSKPKTLIELDLIESSKHVIISIKDQGPGFSEEDQEKIFKKYQQLSARPTAGEPSTGLGLSIIKSYVDMMWGDITFETELGKGTTFFVKLRKA